MSKGKSTDPRRPYSRRLFSRRHPRPAELMIYKRWLRNLRCPLPPYRSPKQGPPHLPRLPCHNSQPRSYLPRQAASSWTYRARLKKKKRRSNLNRPATLNRGKKIWEKRCRLCSPKNLRGEARNRRPLICVNCKNLWRNLHYPSNPVSQADRAKSRRLIFARHNQLLFSQPRPCHAPPFHNPNPRRRHSIRFRLLQRA